MYRLSSAQRGQILIPALFVIPSLVLFLFLIVETGKLSREKIRHQFAVDAASFIEMSNYSEFLSRSAYVNGAFPQRIFAEGFATTMIDRKNGTTSESLFDILYKDGDFPSIGPASSSPNTNPTDSDNPWKIQFDSSGCGAAKNSANPDLTTCGGTGGHGKGDDTDKGGGAVDTGGGTGSAGGNQLDIISMQNAIDYWLSWDDANDIYNLYVQIYQLLGQVEDAQFSVWQRLSGNGTHAFFKKSYYLNTLDAAGTYDASEGPSAFNRSFSPKASCIDTIMFYGNKPTANPFQPYQIFAPQTPIGMNSTMSTGPNACSGLFHIETVPQSDLDSMDESHDSTGYRGYNVVQHYSTWASKSGSPNYFNINFDGALGDPICGNSPCVHSTINLAGGSVWPNPTPKYQTRLYP